MTSCDVRQNDTLLLSHRINNPLFAILGLTELLLAEAEPGARGRERLELIRESALEIREIVRGLTATEGA